MKKGKTFIHHDGALGDVLLSLPCLRVIQDISCPVHFAGRADIGRLFFNTGIAQEISPADGVFYASAYSDTPDDAVAEFLGNFQQAFVFTARSNSLLASNIRRFIPETKIILTTPDEKERRHVSEYRLSQLVRQGALQTNLHVPDSFREKAMFLLQGRRHGRSVQIIALHPGSGGKKKCWPLKNYLKLIARIWEDYDSIVVLITGPAEGLEIKREIHDFVAGFSGAVHIDGQDLTTVAALLGIATLYIGNDSGISHLAASVNTPSIVLFGPTDPLLWKPVGRQVHVIAQGDYPGSLENIRVADVYEKAIRILENSR